MPPRKLTVTIAIVLTLGLAGCGKDKDAADATAQGTATTAAPTTTSAGTDKKTDAATPGKTTTTGSKSTGSATKTTTTKASATKTTSTTASAGTDSATKKKQKQKQQQATTTTTKVVPSTPVIARKPSSSGPSSGTGSGPTGERLEIVIALRRYYKAFLDKDGDSVCALLSDAGQTALIQDAGGAKNCSDSAKKIVDSASADNLDLLEATREGLHVDDVKVTGTTGTAQIGKTSKLNMIRVGGRWLVASPNVVSTS